MRDGEMSPWRNEELEEETQEDGAAQSRRMAPGEEGKQESDRVTVGRGDHAPAEGGTQGGRKRRGEGEADLGPRGEQGRESAGKAGRE